MGNFTLDHNTEVDIYIDDIINNIDDFNNDELLILKSEIEQKLNQNTFRRETPILEASTLEDEYKIQILRELFNKLSWSELEELKKKLI